MIITFARHGEVETPYIGCYNGHNSIGLSAKGRYEASYLADALSSKNFDAVFSSDLPRARETLHHFRWLENVYFTPELREKSWGKHEGMRYEEIVEHDGLIYHDFQQWISLLDGEPYEDFRQRVKQFFFKTLAAKPYSCVLVVSHAGVIRMLYALVLDLTLQEAFSLSFPYGAYTTFDTQTKKFTEVICAT